MKRTLAAETTSAKSKKARDESDDDDEPILPTKAPNSPKKASTSAKPATKLASIFQPRTAASSSSSANGASSSKGLKWLDPIGPNRSCLHGVYGDPTPSSKVAFFDLDGTIVRPKGGKTFPSKTDEYDFDFLFPTPPAGTLSVIKRIRQQHLEQGFAIVVITNQKQTAYSAKSGLSTWKKKMAHIAAALDVPLRVFASLADDTYRKPRLGMWDEFIGKWNGGLEVNRGESFFVGDAAGRKKYRDHQDTDLKWALNAGLGFYTPEEYFLGKDKEYEIPSRPWSPSALVAPGPSLKGLVAEPEDEMVTVDLSTLDETSSDLLLGNASNGKPEIVLFVGAPASGKTYLYNRLFAPANYVHVNQDTLRTRDKCLGVVSNTISSSASCVVDNTNRDKATRRHYIDLARNLGVSIRCIYFDVPKNVCVHNNHFRAHHGPTSAQEIKRGILPFTAIESWFKDRQVPKMAEGFSAEIVRVTWGWSGDEAVEERYKMYYH
ncbi:related to bifunctional polynucleotide phosphatase/kinase [Ustilago trichophora]|uniref:Related to bifunctional polynucleotide phosphatase/kinase n=1 Tax=Ustilago trichophora TaxID=86804 RepID=A0A5C3E979_9BASI|nr:related to bifunctional polynucleotide phosphatase/kinase [Ustilago trichophora]